MIHRKAFVSYCDFDIIKEFGIDETKKSIINDIKKDHDIIEDAAEWHVCSCGVECKIILIIQAVKKNATRLP